MNAEECFRKRIWRTKDNRCMPISLMGYKHIYYTIQMLKKKVVAPNGTPSLFVIVSKCH